MGDTQLKIHAQHTTLTTPTTFTLMTQFRYCYSLLLCDSVHHTLLLYMRSVLKQLYNAVALLQQQLLLHCYSNSSPFTHSLC
jgi:hypothetical protein